MKETIKKSNIRCLPVTFFLVTALIIATTAGIVAQAPAEKGVRFEMVNDQNKVDIFINGSLFSSYRYPADLEKPFLYPVIAPNGSVLTRGYPLEPRKGERIDHPHQIGLWFNHGSINGLDFWNNSSAIPADKKDSYGHIVVREFVKTANGKKGVLEVVCEWKDNRGNTVLLENVRYIFSGDANSRTMDHVSTLTAVNGPVTIVDNKEGLFAIRVDRAFEMPSNEALVFTDDKGNPTTVKATDNTGVTGMYTSSQGLKGDDVWGTRNNWVLLSGNSNNTVVTFGIFDHPDNPGYPAYAHARGYGLFSVNNLGQNSYDPKQEKVEWKLARGESLTLRHRFYVKSGSEMTAREADKIFKKFSKLY